MKRLFLFCSLILACLVLSAQTNLEFNRVVILKGDISGNGTVVIAGTVPSGKVWKVENLAMGSSVYWEQTAGSSTAFLTGSNSNYVANSDNSEMLRRPVWLPAGEDIRLRSVTSGLRGYYFSIIEFNVNTN